VQNERHNLTAVVTGRTSDSGSPGLRRVRRLVEAIREMTAMSVIFLDPAGILSDFDNRGSLVPLEDRREILSPSLASAALRLPAPVLHIGEDSCAAVSVPFIAAGHLGGFVTAVGFSLVAPDAPGMTDLKATLAAEPESDVFGLKPNCPEIDLAKFRALIELLNAVASEMVLLCEEARVKGTLANGEGLPTWAEASTVEVTPGSAPSELSEAVKARERLEALYDSTRDAILMLDKDLRIVAANKEFGRLFGAEPNAFLGVTGAWLRRWVVKNAKEPQRVSAQIDRLMADPAAILDDEIELLSPHSMVLRFYSAPVMDKLDQVIGRVLMFRDITQFRRAHRDLIGNEKMSALGRAAAGLAHEINNIMAGVMTYADYALEEGTNEKMREALRMSVAAAEKASQLVGEFLSVSGPTETLRQDVDLHLELERLLDSIEQAYKKDNIRIHRLLEAVPRVSVDPVQILKVFHQVLQNACEAMGRDGTITARTETDWDRGTVRVIISDSGPGIPPEYIERIFDPFFTTKGVVSGGDTAAKGLGLSVARGIIEAHGGKIYAGNVLPHGASFVIELPLPGTAGEQPPSPSQY
jgi:signal transduction histidine kinase